MERSGGVWRWVVNVADSLLMVSGGFKVCLGMSEVRNRRIWHLEREEGICTLEMNVQKEVLLKGRW
jgi:hypothetical protein